MRPRDRHYPLGSTSLEQPRRLGSLINTTYASAIHTASLLYASSSQHDGYPGMATAYGHEASSSDEDYQSAEEAIDEDGDYEDDEGDYEDDYYEEDGEEEDEDAEEDEEDQEDQEDQEERHIDHFYTHHHHHHYRPPHTLQLPHHPYLHRLDEYDSDMSDDAGTPVVNYLDITNIITGDNMTIDSSISGEESDDVELEFSSEIDVDQDGDDDGVETGVETGSASAPESEIESEFDSDIIGESHGGNSSVESQFADDGSVFAVSQPYPPGFMSPGLTPESVLSHAPILPHVPMPPQLPGQMPSQSFAEYLLAEHGVTGWFEPSHPSNTNPATLDPNNYGLVGFLHQWARQSRMLQGLSRGKSPWPAKINELAASEATRIKYEALQGDKCDIQGVNWDDLGVSRKEARERRLLTYSNYVNQAGSDRWTPDLPDVILPRSDNFFRFRRMDIKRNVNLAHFQLRYLLASTSRTRIFYPGVHSVHQFNPISRETRPIIKTGDTPGSQVSAIACDYGVLVAGCFNGDYNLRHLDTPETGNKACRTGNITTDPSGITNHIQIHQRRSSSSPAAAFSSNDNAVRVLDIETEKWISQEKFDFAINCTATSPDKRLRAVVGDNLQLLITAAESTLPDNKPEVFYNLSGHRDYGFAVDWADDGWTIASAFQDKTVKIWDARCLTDSSGNSKTVTTIRTELAGARNLRFSPVGSGRRVLVAAEEADYVNVIDAQTFRTKQTIDFFGEIGGVTFANEGEDLLVLCCDPDRGGILQFERCGAGGNTLEYEDWVGDGLDWPKSRFAEDRMANGGRAGRGLEGRAWVGCDIEPF